MTTIAASQVKELRDRTGAGMMECKRALEETSGDVDAAIQLLRERGVAQAGKRAGRETTEGKVGYRIADDHATMVAVGCETEPVSNNDEFLTFARRVLDVVDGGGPQAVEPLEDDRVALIARLGENILVRGATRMERDGKVIAGYTHAPLNKIGVLVKGTGPEEAVRRVAVHIAAARPRYLSREDVPEDEVSAERAIYEKQPDVQSKPETVREKIVEGMLGKRFFAESVLDNQPWVYEPGKSVGQVLREDGVEIVDFVRYDVGE
ncbi:MAG: translation elongation factor Ts [Actinobacteria bacterium]|nr:translation elongation factor Ts [Actinomycetota bacterium]